MRFARANLNSHLDIIFEAQRPYPTTHTLPQYLSLIGKKNINFLERGVWYIAGTRLKSV